MNVNDAIHSRVSYRGKYQNTPVLRDALQVIMQAGLAAPSGCNKQTTSLIAVDDPSLLKRLNALIHSPICETAPAMICVLTQKIIAYRGRSFYIQDYSAAIENMLLAAVGLGLSSCWIEGHITDKDQIGRKIADALGVPTDYELVCILPLGYAAEEVVQPPKKAFSERAWFNGIGTAES